MQDQTASHTALATAYMRGAHQLFDDRPLLFEDRLALAILGAKAEDTIREHQSRHQSRLGRALRCHVCLRARLAEDHLALAVAQGVTAYVLVGAGLDTFAWRQPDWAKGLRIIEVDHPATQAAKSERLAQAGLALPDNLTMAPTDFTRETLGEVLARHGLGLNEPVFFSWLGVSMYLEKPAIAATLKAMAAFAPGSGLVMTFKQPPGDGPRRAAMEAELVKTVSDSGEAFLSFFTPEAMRDMLLGRGFTRAEVLSPETIRETYFTPARADLPAPRQANMALAWK